jgi:hypothetical protein
VTSQKTPFFIVTAVKTSNLTLFRYVLSNGFLECCYLRLAVRFHRPVPWYVPVRSAILGLGVLLLVQISSQPLGFILSHIARLLRVLVSL